MHKSTFVKTLYFMLILLMPYGINAQLELGTVEQYKFNDKTLNFYQPDVIGTFSIVKVVNIFLSSKELNPVFTINPKPAASGFDLNQSLERTQLTVVTLKWVDQYIPKSVAAQSI